MGMYAAIGIALLVAGALVFFLTAGQDEGTPLSTKPGEVDRAEPESDPAPARASVPARVSVPGDVKANADKGSAPAITARPLPLDADEGELTMPNPWILVMAVGRTDPGMKRKHNEDAYLVLDDHHLFVVADGMGRHAAGEIASKLCVDTIGAAFAARDFGPPQEGESREAGRLRGALALANQAVFDKSREVEAYAGMGTTAVALHFSASKDSAVIAHAGDSRCYRLRNAKLEQLTKDHTLGAAGIVGPSASVLSKAVGIEENLDAEIQLLKPEPGDVYLICSDGLSRMATDEQITEIILQEPDLDVAAERLIQVANQAGGRDNVTVILVRVDGAKVGAAA